MSDPSPGPAAAPTDREIVTTRVLDAPRELVFGAFSDPARLARWWGPAGFTNTFHEFDMRPNGAWRFVMHGPDGVDHPNESVFLDVVKPERIVFQHVSSPKFRMTITLADEAGKTRIEWRMRFESAQEFAPVASLVTVANEQNFDRLEAQLRSMSDEQAMRRVVAQWHAATAAGDVESVLGLMSEDVVFLVPGRPPMKGRRTFETQLRALLASHRVVSSGDVQEVEVSGDLGYCWSVLTVRVTPLSGGDAVVRQGSALSIFRRQPGGAWVIVRDANLLAAAS